MVQWLTLSPHSTNGLGSNLLADGSLVWRSPCYSCSFLGSLTSSVHATVSHLAKVSCMENLFLTFWPLLMYNIIYSIEKLHFKLQLYQIAMLQFMKPWHWKNRLTLSQIQPHRAAGTAEDLYVWFLLILHIIVSFQYFFIQASSDYDEIHSSIQLYTDVLMRFSNGATVCVGSSIIILPSLFSLPDKENLPRLFAISYSFRLTSSTPLTHKCTHTHAHTL